MPGFFGYLFKKHTAFSIKDKENLINEEIKYDNIYLHRHSINKFMNDKVFEETNKYIIVVEGVILNLNDLKAKYKTEKFADIIQKMYEELGETFYKEFRGSFSGLIYIKQKKLLIIYTDQIGTKQIFILHNENYLVFSSQITDIIEFCKELDITVSLNKAAAYLLLTNSYLHEDLTLINEIKKLPPGTYSKYSDSKLELNQYYKISNETKDILSEDEIIEKIDSEFKKALKKSLVKNREYGYKNLASLSGGLDSRMTTWVLNEIKEREEEIINYTYSQSNYLDEKIASEISSFLGTTFIFKSLDNGLSLTKIDEATQISEGMILYPSLGQLVEFIDLFNFKEIGIVHTGMLGDVIIGADYATSSTDNQINIFSKATSLKLKKRIKNLQTKFSYKNEEIFNFYSRGFSGMNLGAPSILQHYAESYSPFYDIDFLDFCLSIPIKYRMNHHIYYKWILKKYPNAAKYKWEKINAKITTPHIKIGNKKVPLIRLLPKIFQKLKIFKFLFDPQKGMTPYEYWYKNHELTKNHMDKYFNENVLLIKEEELKSDCIELYNKGNVMEKCLVLSLLGAFKLFNRYGLVIT